MIRLMVCTPRDSDESWVEYIRRATHICEQFVRKTWVVQLGTLAKDAKMEVSRKDSIMHGRTLGDSLAYLEAVV